LIMKIPGDFPWETNVLFAININISSYSMKEEY